ncbi:pilus assembly protein HofM [Raoultella sp. BIGb0138]|uniref:pilus assembly protein n=1 Tax=Raoultella sp. BIGb0138 TaxID=2485115 RepID=UPI00104A5BBE|nr:pilus assembly protein [Raoultella sp. BIGb0138]TCW06030.1 pilus assembly protein HofM [Raoultella sp. BIGb0138]
MAFSNWRIGMHIQQDAVFLVALRYARSRWALCRWWHIPLAPGIVRQGMVVDVAALAKALQSWRRELPLQHRVSIAFPAGRTLQKRLPRPQLALSESEQATWIASVMSQQLEMPASALCVDYTAAPADKEWRVTAAQRPDIDRLRQLAERLTLKVVAIVPDASALAAFLPWLPSDSPGLAWRNGPHWLWATLEGWGSAACAEAPSASQLSSLINVGPLWLCSDRSAAEPCFDPWSVIHRLQPPLPRSGERFAIALGLALGRHSS